MPLTPNVCYDTGNTDSSSLLRELHALSLGRHRVIVSFRQDEENEWADGVVGWVNYDSDELIYMFSNNERYEGSAPPGPCGNCAEGNGDECVSDECTGVFSTPEELGYRYSYALSLDEDSPQFILRDAGYAAGTTILNDVSGVHGVVITVEDKVVKKNNTNMASTTKEKEVEVEATTKKPGKKSINLFIRRVAGKTLFGFEIDPELEALYKSVSKEQRESKNWKGLKFYLCPSITDSPEYRSKLSGFQLFDDFGATFYKDNKLNIAWVRTVGGKGEIEIPDNVSFASLTLLVRNLIQFIKEHYEDNFREFKIVGSIAVDM